MTGLLARRLYLVIRGGSRKTRGRPYLDQAQHMSKKFPEMKNNTKVIHMNMFTINQSLSEMVQMK